MICLFEVWKGIFETTNAMFRLRCGNLVINFKYVGAAIRQMT